MAEKFRIGVLGLTHDHVWGNLDQLLQSEQGELVAVADPHLPLVQQATEKYGCRTYGDYEQMLDGEKLDGVFLFGDNASGVMFAELAASRGLPMLIEKPMAADVSGADRMIAAARRAGVRLMVNWPFAWWPQMQTALAMAAEGKIGTLWQVKYRAAHAGPQELGCSPYFCDWLFDPHRNGGGALIDYCCYGSLLARLLLGVPSRVSGVAGRLLKETIPVEDNAVIVMRYPHAIAVSEGSWTEIGNLLSYTTLIYGTEGTLLIEPRLGGRLRLATADDPHGSDVPVPEPPPERRNASEHFIDAVTTGAEFAPMCRDRNARDAQEILQAATISAASGGEVSLPLSDGLM